MHTVTANLATIAMAMLWLTPLAIADLPALPEEVTKGKAAYQQKLQEFKHESEAAKAELTVRYRKGLDALRLAARQKGDLEGVQAADEEIQRFEKQAHLPPGAQPSARPELAKAGKNYREALVKVDVDAARKVIDCTDRYLQFLDQRVKLATREDKLDLARAFDAEQKVAREMPDYQAARFLLAEENDAEAAKDALPAAADPMSAAAVPATTNPPAPFVLAQPRIGRYGEHLQPRLDPAGLYDAERLTEGAIPAVLGTGPVSFKQLAATETGKAAFSGGVSILADGFLDLESAKYQLRIKLRTKSTNTNFTNLKIVVQYFGRNPNNATIQEMRTLQFALIPSLGAKSMVCEFKPIDLPYEYLSRRRGGSDERDGAFAGVVVSVYASDDKLIGQVASSNALKDKGKAAFELPATWMEHVRKPRRGEDRPR